MNRDNSGTAGSKSTSALVPKKTNGAVLESKKLGCKPSHGAVKARDCKPQGRRYSDQRGAGYAIFCNAPTTASPPKTIKRLVAKLRTQLRRSAGTTTTGSEESFSNFPLFFTRTFGLDDDILSKCSL